MSKLGVITNPTSGSGRGARWGADTMTALSASGHQLRDLSRGSWAASYEAAMQHRRDIDALVVVGGDGMVHLGLQVCADRKLPLGIVAAGSGNDAAVTLNLPVHDIPAAVARINDGLAGDVTAIDLGKVTGPGIDLPNRPRYFIAVLSAGIDAAIAAYAQGLKYPRGPLKYKVATMRELPRFTPYGISVTTGKQTERQECTLIAVANSPILGGGLEISPNSSVTDGFLELVVADTLSRREILKIFPRLSNGSVLEDPRVHVTRVESVTIEASGEGAPLPAAFADGELVGSGPLHVSVAKRALRVLGAKPA